MVISDVSINSCLARLALRRVASPLLKAVRSLFSERAFPNTSHSAKVIQKSPHLKKMSPLRPRIGTNPNRELPSFPFLISENYRKKWNASGCECPH